MADSPGVSAEKQTKSFKSFAFGLSNLFWICAIIAVMLAWRQSSVAYQSEMQFAKQLLRDTSSRLTPQKKQLYAQLLRDSPEGKPLDNYPNAVGLADFAYVRGSDGWTMEHRLGDNLGRTDRFRRFELLGQHDWFDEHAGGDEPYSNCVIYYYCFYSSADEELIEEGTFDFYLVTSDGVIVKVMSFPVVS